MELKLDTLVKKGKVTAIELQGRDVDLMLYLNEMGWAQADILCLKFFCDSPNEMNEGRLKTAKRRLWCLKEAGYIRAFRLGKDSSCFFVTRKGVQVLTEKRPQIVHLKPIQGLYISISEHTKRVQWSRIALEFAKESAGWRSERRLKVVDLDIQKAAFEGRFPPYFPDGIYINKEGKKTVFEYEHAEKTTKQIESKIVQIERLLDFFPSRYEQVLIVTTTEQQAETYKKMIQNKPKFKIEVFNEMLKSGGINGVFEQR